MLPLTIDKMTSLFLFSFTVTYSQLAKYKLFSLFFFFFFAPQSCSCTVHIKMHLTCHNAKTQKQFIDPFRSARTVHRVLSCCYHQFLFLFCENNKLGRRKKQKLPTYILFHIVNFQCRLHMCTCCTCIPHAQRSSGSRWDSCLIAC